MNKILTGIFVALFTLPAFAASIDDCAIRVRQKYAFDAPANNPRYQQIYNQIKNDPNSEFNKQLDTPLTQNLDGMCTLGMQSYPYTCQAGQTLRQCQPQQCQNGQLEFIAEEQFINEMIDAECNGNTRTVTTPDAPEISNDIDVSYDDIQVPDMEFNTPDTDLHADLMDIPQTPSESTSAPESNATTMFVTGTVVDNIGPVVGADISVPGLANYATTDANGHFSLEVTSITDEILISGLGYNQQFVSVSSSSPDVGTITLTMDDDMMLDAVVVQSVQPGDPCSDSDIAKIPHAESGTYRTNANGGISCRVTKCKSPYIADEQNNKCLGDGDNCLTLPTNARSGKYELRNGKLLCIVRCAKGFLPDDNDTACIPSEGSCTPEQIFAIENATNGELKNGVCHATECNAGFDVSDGKCVPIAGDCHPMPENAIAAHREWDTATGTEVCIIDTCADGYSPSPDKKSCITPILSQEDSLAQISELQANADAMRDKEQSTANKILGAAGIGATGIGLMQTASALAQQNASNDATRDMTAYLATFRCDYGSGRNISGGETGITLPGGNQLLPLYTEYITLASDLKTRKEALGLSPGIESEIIQDSATSGLYDNVSLGRGDGMYVSLAAALSDPTGPAAAAWAAQQSATSEQLQTGLITAGVGTLASIIGNIAINENKKSPQNLTDDIIAKYEPLKSLENAVAILPDQDADAQCPSNATGTYPNCVCSDTKSAYNKNTNTCDICPGDKISVNNTCQCPAGTTEMDNDVCIAPIATCQEYECDITAANIRFDTTDCSCTCDNGFIPQYSPDNPEYITACACPSPNHIINLAGQCVKNPTSPIDRLQIPAPQLFAVNESRLTTDAEKIIKDFATDVKQTSGTNANYCISVIGNTDKTGNDAINTPLSQQRADAVRDVLIESGLNPNNITSIGAGSSACPDIGDQPDCRNIEIQYSNTVCQV